ncbi:ATP-dependent DNA helicase [Ramlibacter rhizophilus]|uniref:ATP-dependent DNA helicase n=1 Tax=Ramlibacter rhizophilus TaxID=1781167 RepID=A0A4Z0C205_9BURK|nr:ATP-dependent DNA helicase [Ramlibacter rhizophilus]TFZ04864.1 ATP-dependent DNA helicase [Ramlibacter rhizophilus]
MASAHPSYLVSVRTLCEFTARGGDLDLRLTPSPTAAQGIAGHQLVAARRGTGYETEIALEATSGPLRVRGRADGFDPALQRLEEIKTHRADLSRQPSNHRHLHWAQLKVYGWMLCQARGLPELRLALVYLDLGSAEETVREESCSADALREHFEGLCARFVDWARREAAHRTARDAALAALAFPHGQFRAGQRALAEAVWRGIRSGRSLLAQAPTGIGKTLGTLFPALKACPGEKLDKVVFLAAKTPGRQLAIEGLAQLARAGATPLRVVELTAREKACEHPDKACHPESCPLARGFYDRLPAARDDALARPLLDRRQQREAALAHEVCPYWLSHELVRWADVIVADYNYWFDTSAMLHAWTLELEWRCAVLVDEAHNLVERGRQMYSAELDESALRALRRTAPAGLKRPLERLARRWREQGRELEAVGSGDYQAQDQLPGPWLDALQQATAALAEHLAEHLATLPGELPQAPSPELQRFYFDALAITRLAESFGTHSIAERRRVGAGARAHTVVGIRNLLPAPHLAPRFAAARSTVLFSATLAPVGFYRDTLGVPESAGVVDVPSPFEAGQLSIRVAGAISTRWADRARAVQPIAALIERQWRERPGNYLAFFSSYDFQHQVAHALAQACPELPLWEQSAGMGEAERQAFLERFTEGGSGVGFAVLGGSFGEGVDLPGERLVGAFVATLGLPQVNPVNELLRERLHSAFGAGYEYAYLYPGLRRVAQAAGRVIRSEQDRGVLWLIDDRFSQARVRALLPRWWQWPVR